MADGDVRPPGAHGAQAGEGRRRIGRRQKRLILAAAVVVVALIATFWGAQTEEFVTPSQLAANPAGYAGTVIQLRGVVKALDASAQTFLLGDTAANVTVKYAVLPEAFQIGKEVIARGKVLTISPLLFEAQEIVVGHAG